MTTRKIDAAETMAMSEAAIAQMNNKFLEMRGSPAEKWVAYDSLVRLLEFTVEVVKQERAKASDATIEWMVDNNMTRATVLGRSLRIDSTARLSLKGPSDDFVMRERLIEALRSNGLGDLISEQPGFNFNTISAWYRRAIEEGEEIPEDLLAAVNVNDTERIQGTKA